MVGGVVTMRYGESAPEIIARVKSGFGVPTGAWMNVANSSAVAAVRGRPREAKELISRDWSQTVLHGFA